MPETGRFKKILVLSPPFYSHFRPLSALAAALADQGANVLMACEETFRTDIEDLHLEFRPISLNRNSNRGNARSTSQGAEEHRRLEEFLESTHHGPVAALTTQARHRRADMLPDPDGLADEIEHLARIESPDLWIVDQLSYGATLALTGMGENFATFCAPHPSAIPGPGRYCGIPETWPSPFHIEEKDLGELLRASKETDTLFTREFNRILKTRYRVEGVDSAFRHASSSLIVHNYPELDRGEADTGMVRHIYGGHSVQQIPLTDDWKEWLEGKGPGILIALGTFLSSRWDVLDGLISGVRRILPNARIAVGAGDSQHQLRRHVDSRIRISDFIPQSALLPGVDLAIHHGGVSSFTETLYAGKPAVILPFSSDQFDVASDAEHWKLGTVIDPNRFSDGDLERAIQTAFSSEILRSVSEMSLELHRRGPEWTARRLYDT